MAEDPISGGQAKPIVVRNHLIRELLVEHKVPSTQYTESSNQLADILTKPLGTKGLC